MDQGRVPTADHIIRARNTLLQCSDLRRVVNLEKQLRAQTNLTEDASQSLVSLLQVLRSMLSPSRPHHAPTCRNVLDISQRA